MLWGEGGGGLKVEGGLIRTRNNRLFPQISQDNEVPVWHVLHGCSRMKKMLSTIQVLSSLQSKVSPKLSPTGTRPL